MSNQSHTDQSDGAVWVVLREYEWGGDYGEKIIGVAATEDAAARIADEYKAPRGSGRTVGIDWHEWCVTT